MKMYDYYKEHNLGKESYNAMDYFGKKFTYGYVNEWIERYAKALKGYGIKPGDYISLLLPNMPEIVYLKLAINRVGGVINLIDPRYNPNTILKLINDAHSKIVICLFNIYNTGIKPIRNQLKVQAVFTINLFESIGITDIKPKSGLVKNLIIVGACISSKFRGLLSKIGYNFSKYKNTYDIAELLKYQNNYTGEIDSSYLENTPVTVLYTSGTTGDMLKGTVHTNEGYNALAAELEYAFPEERPGMIISALIPMFLSYGSGVCMFNSLVAGFEMKMHPIYAPQDFVKIVEHDRPNIIVGVPKFVQMMSDSKKSFDYVNHIVIGGDKLQPNKLIEFRKRFPKARIAVGYGESEMLGVVSVSLNNEERPDSSGIPLPGVKIRVLNHYTHEEMPCGEAGEAYISGLTQMIGYLNNPEQTAMISYYDSETGERFLATGDIIRMTPEGEIIFVDRIKRMMKRPDGHQVNSDMVENALASIKEIKEVCVVGLKYKDMLGVIPTAFIETYTIPGRTELVDECEKVSVEQLASARDKALAYVFIDSMPYTKNGKVDIVDLSNRKLEDIPDAVIVDHSFI